MWSRNPTPVSRTPAPSPSTPRLTKISVSPVFRSISAVRDIIAIVANAGFHRPGVDLEPLRPGDWGGGTRKLGPVADPYLAEAAKEMTRGQCRGEPRGPVRREHVVRACDVVPKRRAGIRPYEQASGVGRTRRERLGLGADELQVLGGERLSQGQRVVRAPHAHERGHGARIGRRVDPRP